MKLGMYYDQSFKAKFGADSVNAMRRVVAQVILLHLRPVGPLNVLPISFVNVLCAWSN